LSYWWWEEYHNPQGPDCGLLATGKVMGGMRLKGWTEIPIGGLILEAGSAAAYHTGGWRAFRPVHGAEECSHCLQCWLYCPDSSILVDAAAERMAGFDLDHCKGCGICAAICPSNAKARRRAGEELARDDARLCIRMLPESEFEDRP
jgi:2-oxoacid:acceptor oxidoreductase delta subunit (pyruvate/2-ketoisovalerate family)